MLWEKVKRISLFRQLYRFIVWGALFFSVFQCQKRIKITCTPAYKVLPHPAPHVAPALIPYPKKYKESGDSLRIGPAISIHYAQDVFAPAAYLLEKELLRLRPLSHIRRMPYPTQNTDPESCTPPLLNPSPFSLILDSDIIHIYLTPEKNYAPPRSEAYTLSVFPQQKSIRISGNPKGVFYGIQSLLQLFYQYFNASVFPIPACHIEDYPDYTYRGLMLDVARHFFSVQELKKIIRLMAAYKLNKLHLHLSDDQGWRIESKTFPYLTQIGSKRRQTLIGKDKGIPEQYRFKNEIHQGYYTQKEIKDLVYYARLHQIDIIPEIDMPAHSLAMLSAYPHLACFPEKNYEVQGWWRGAKTPLCMAKESTYTFLEQLLREYTSLFPAACFHIGQDEVPHDTWLECPDCQKKLRQLKSRNPQTLQYYAYRRLQKILEKNGKTPIIWDDIFDPEHIAKNTTVMVWRREKNITKALRHQYPCIVASSKKLYLDFYQTPYPEKEPLSRKGRRSLKDIYTYPLPAKALGAQALLWTEYVPDISVLEYKLFPRIIGLAENVWTSPKQRHYEHFYQRLRTETYRLQRENIHYAPF